MNQKITQKKYSGNVQDLTQTFCEKQAEVSAFGSNNFSGNSDVTTLEAVAPPP
jgi:hypothetical protein